MDTSHNHEAQTQLPSDSLMEFAKRLLKEKNFHPLDPEVVAQMEADLYARVEDRINAMILSKMPKDKLEEFDKLLDDPDHNKLQQFCAQMIPNLPEAIASELLSFRQTYLNG